MLPSRLTGQPSAIRKSRLEGSKPSLLPIPRRAGSTDRLSAEARRSSAMGRSSSVDPPRATFAGGRLSREASASKLSVNRRSRSQQDNRYTQSHVTPLKTSQYSSRPTTTPVRSRFWQSYITTMTPLDGHVTPRRTPDGALGRTWEQSLDRALAFLTVKDQRPVTNPGWQRSQASRIHSGYCGRTARAAEEAGRSLIRPLTIARFVDIASVLLQPVVGSVKLNSDNYVAKLPNLSKRLLYPGNVSKSWLKAVNTLHAFPHALALLSYFLDLADHIERPISDEELYSDNDDLAILRRNFIFECWFCFQEQECLEARKECFKAKIEEYVRNLTNLLREDLDKIDKLQQEIEKCESVLQDSAVAEARAEEARRAARRDAALAARRTQQADARHVRAAREDQARVLAQQKLLLAKLDDDIDRANAENQQLTQELKSQSMSVSERARLLDEVDYAVRVKDSKQALAEQITKVVQTKETELALWQNKTLESCVEYKQGIIQLSAEFPQLAALAFDEKELMSTECAEWVPQAVDTLRECSRALAERRAEHSRAKCAHARKQHALIEETRATIAKLKLEIQQEEDAMAKEASQESTAEQAWANEIRELNERREQLASLQEEYKKVDEELEFWEIQDKKWREKLSEMQEYIETQRSESERLLEEAVKKRVALVKNNVAMLNEKLDQM